MNLRLNCGILAAGVGLALMVGHAGQSTAGNVVLEYESLNGGGVSFATNGVYRLGGSMGQNNFVAQSIDTSAWVLTGFWTGESGCALYPTWITGVGIITESLAIEFNVIAGNTYSVLYIAEEEGGLSAGTGSWTNLVAPPFVATDAMGGKAVVYDDITTVTNQARYYRIQCE